MTINLKTFDRFYFYLYEDSHHKYRKLDLYDIEHLTQNLTDNKYIHVEINEDFLIERLTHYWDVVSNFIWVKEEVFQWCNSNKSLFNITPPILGIHILPYKGYKKKMFQNTTMFLPNINDIPVMFKMLWG